MKHLIALSAIAAGLSMTAPPSLAQSAPPPLPALTPQQQQEVDARMATFQSSIEQMLWPERRDKDAVLGDKVPGVIDRTTARSYLRIPAGYLPDYISRRLADLTRVAPSVPTSRKTHLSSLPTMVGSREAGSGTQTISKR